MILPIIRPYIMENQAETHQFLASTVQGGSLFVTGLLSRAGAIGVRQWWRRGDR